jgi:hypothetical protein
MNLSNIHLFSRNNLLLTGLFLVTSLHFGCEKDPEPLTTYGVIRGHAGLYDVYTEEPANIKITASGPYGNTSTTTEADGGFILDGLGNGTYYLDYSKEGYGTIREYNIRVFDDDTVFARGAALFQKPASAVPNFIKAYTAYKARFFPLTTYVCIEESANNNGTVFGLDLMLFMDTSPDVAWNRNGFSYPASDAYVNDDNVHTIYVPPSIIPFESGTTVYVKGYPCNVQEYGYGYFDTYLGIPQYSTLDKSKSTNVVSFIMP